LRHPSFGTSCAFASKGGMPQLEPEFWIAQIFWLVLIFSILYIVIWKVFLPKITNNIENRKSKVVSDLNETQKLKERAEIKLNEYNKIIEDSKREAKDIIAANKRKLDNDIKNKKIKFEEEIEKELISTEKEIKKLRKK
jgi:F-type H+-transporting ATPase subunit b